MRSPPAPYSREMVMTGSRRQAPAAPRYRPPPRGFTWDGRGRQPQWLRAAVLREGYLLAQLRYPRPLAN